MSSVEVSEIVEQNAGLVQRLAHTDGTLESPINLDISRVKVIELAPLEWNGIEMAPRKLKITNTGYTVILSANWLQDKRPYLSAGPIAGNYVFAQIHFHWGETEMDGSEHAVDGSKLPMELHAVHFKEEYDTLEAALRRPDGVTVLVYFCKLQNEPNEFIQEIVKQLSVIRTAHSSVRIMPSSMTNIIKPFSQDYFLYWGSIITIHNVHSILWLACREPIGVTTGQIAEFRTLRDERDMPIKSNIRPLRRRRGRNVFHVCPSGSTYASLLPIPRIPQAQQTDGNTSTQNVTTA